MKSLLINIFATAFLFSACNRAEKNSFSSDSTITAKQPPIWKLSDSEHLGKLLTIDSNTKQYININVHSDTTLIKALISKLSEKEEKGIWETLFPIIVAFLPMVLGYFGYKYAIRQIVVKQKLDWINSIRILGSKLITEIVKSEVTFGEMYKVHEEYNEAGKEVDNIQTEISEILGKKQPVDKELTDKMDEAKIKLNERTKEKVEAEIKYKNDFFVTYQLLNEMIINLDTTSYSTHRQLEQAIIIFKNSLDVGNDRNPEDLSKDVVDKIKDVVSEQRRLAEGGAG